MNFKVKSPFPDIFKQGYHMLSLKKNIPSEMVKKLYFGW